jgi:all-beta uncharacterized protein/BACON domain-containing protein
MRQHSRIGASLPALLAILLGCGHESGPAEPTPLPCTYTLSSTSFSFPAAATSAAVTVATASHCAWNAAADREWIALSATTGSGSGTITISASPNAAIAERSGTVTVAGHAVSVRQDGAEPPPCTIDISPGSAAFDSSGGTGTFGVVAPAHCQWSAASDAAWVVVTSGAQGTGTGTVAYSVGRHVETVQRAAAIDVGGRRFTITQAGERAACTYAVSPVDLATCMSAPFDLTVTVTTQAGCTWTSAPDAQWITVRSGAQGAGSGVILFRVTDNWDAPRLGIVMVRWPAVTAGQNVRVAQAGCRYAVSAASIAAPAAGMTGSFDVIQQSDPTNCGGPLQNACIWTAAADVPWIAITTTMPQSGDNPVRFSVAPNASGVSRSGTITVRDRTVRITQAGS